MLADPRCKRDAIAAHWLMLRTSAFWCAVEAFGELKSSDYGDPQPRFLAHDVPWWKRVLAGGDEARKGLSKDDQRRLDAYKLIRIMTQRLRPDTEVMRRPAGPMYNSDGSDGPGHPRTAQEVCDGLQLGEIAPIMWAMAPPWEPAAWWAPPKPAPVMAAGGGGGLAVAAGGGLSKRPDMFLTPSPSVQLTESGKAAKKEYEELVAAFGDGPNTFRPVNEEGLFGRVLTEAEVVEWLLTLPDIDASLAAEAVSCAKLSGCSIIAPSFALFYSGIK